jgi:hypothetical protein
MPRPVAVTSYFLPPPPYPEQPATTGPRSPTAHKTPSGHIRCTSTVESTLLALESIMRAGSNLLLAIVTAGFLSACSTASGPGDDNIDTGNCVTDLSCPFGEECSGSSCGPIAPALRSHIQTASCLLRSPIDDAETSWRASHYDVLIGAPRPDLSRSVNPNVRLFEYVLSRYHRFDRAGQIKTAAQWASANGYNGEDFFLHYREDTPVPTWEGKTVVPGHPEYAAGVAPGWPAGSNASAASRDHSRVVGYYSGAEPWYFANVAHPGYREFLAYHIAGLLDGTWWNNQTFATGPLDGVMIDESIWYPIFGEGVLNRSTEYWGVPVNDSHPYTYAIETLYPALASDLLDEFSATKDIMPNYGHVLFLNYPNRCAEGIQESTPWIYGEVWVTHTGTSSPTSGTSRCISENNDYGQAVREIVFQTRAGGRRVLGARDVAGGTDRGKLLTLGLYYLVHNAHTYYMYENAGHSDPAHVSTWAYNDAVDYDIGQPDQVPAGKTDFEGKANTKEHYVFATGTDPANPSLTYRVYAREFTNALVLVKLMPIGSTVDATSITHHVLGGSFVPLLADGNVGAPVTEVDIRNNEALILIRAD